MERLRQADGALPAPLLHEMLIIRNYDGRGKLLQGADRTGIGTGGRGSIGIGADRSTATSPPAPPHPFLFNISVFVLISGSIFQILIFRFATPLDGIV